MVFVTLFSELCDLFSGCVPEGEDLVDESFPDDIDFGKQKLLNFTPAIFCGIMYQ